MPVIPTRFAVEFGEVFPLGACVPGVEASMAFQADSIAPKQQERDKETNQLVWIVRAIDANEEAARFGAEFKMKIVAPHQPVPPAKIQGFPFAPVEFEGLTISSYANNRGRIAYGFRAPGMRAPGGSRAGKSGAGEQKSAA